MRSRVSLFALLFVVGSFVFPHAAYAGGVPFFGPIVPIAYDVCPASWGLLIEVINNIISLLITLAIVFVAPLMIAYAGFLYVVNPLNPSGIDRAKTVLRNTIVGIVIALAGWLIVDAVMAVLYNPSAAGGTWSSLISGNLNDMCIPQKGALPGEGLNQAPVTGISASGSINNPPSGKTGTACDPSAVQSAAATGGYSLSTTQANILACIAQPETNCGTKNLNYAWGKGTGTSPKERGSTAAGAFQVLLSSNHGCYENSACYSAAGVSGPLNCQNGFDSKGNPKTDPAGAAIVAKCTKAAASLNCSASAAACLLKNNGGSFSPWQADAKSAAQSACITSGGA